MTIDRRVDTVLCVDDDPALLNALRRMLGGIYYVESATDASQAMRILESGRRIDLILSDHRMPGVQGVEMLRQIRKRYPGIPAILMSGHTDVALAIDAVNSANVAKIIQKPVEADALRAHLAEVLGRHLAVEEAPVAIDPVGHPYFMIYQPKACARTGEIHSYEALMRKHEADGRVTSADGFIPQAEAGGYISDLTMLAVQEIGRLAARNGTDMPRIAINLSPVSLISNGFTARFTQGVLEAGLKSSDLILEVTESSAHLTLPAAQSALRALSASGFEIELDDFGAGYSNFGALLDLPLTGVKIDKSIIGRLVCSEAGSSDALELMLTMCGSLGLRTTAEGVETRYQADRLGRIGCQVLQGYYIGRACNENAMCTRRH